MILKKSKLTYFFWILFIVLGFGSLYVASGKNSFLLSALPVDNFVAGITLFALLLVAAEILTVCSKFVAKFSKGREFEVGSFVETILLFFIIVASFMARFIYITSINGSPTDGALFAQTDMSWSETVLLTPTQHLYIGLIHTFSGMLSTPAVSAMYVNVILQLASILLLYFTIRKMMGFVPAMVASVFVAFLPGNITLVGRLDADFIYAFIIVLALFAIVITKWGFLNGKISHGVRLFLLIIGGFISGMALITDKVAVGLILFAICFFVAYKNESNLIYGESRGEILVYLLGVIIGFFTFSSVYDSVYKLGMFGFLNKWNEGFSSIAINTDVLTPGVGDPYALIAMVFMIVWSFRIFKIDRDHGSMIVIIPFMMALLSLLSLTSGIYSSTYIIMWSILGAMGFASIGKNSLSYLEDEKKAKQKADLERREQLEAAKKELEEKKAKLAEINKKKKDNNINIGTAAMTDTQNLKELEASLDFLKKDNEVSEDNNVSEEENTISSVEEAVNSKVEEVVTSPDEKVVDSDHEEVVDADSESAAEVNNTVVLPEKQEEKKLDLKASPIPKEEKPRYVSMSSPSSKFARRMDYRTAIVKANHVEEDENSQNSTSETDTSTIPSSAGSAEDNTTKVISEEIDENKALDDKKEVASSYSNHDTNNDDDASEKEPDLLSVNIIESHEAATDDTQSEEIVEEVAEQKILDDNVLDLTKLEKRDVEAEPTPAPEVNPVSAQEPVLKSVVAEKPPIMGKATEPVNKIHNPLPTPKKHKSRELDYDVEPLAVDMHFDIVDLAGKDFFDIN